MPDIHILYPDMVASDGGVVERDAAGPGVRLDLYKARKADDIPDEVWRNADALLTAIDVRLTEDVIAKLDKCKIICRQGVGVDLIDLRAAGAKGIPVCNVPDYGTTDVADHAIALLLTFTRGIVAYNDAFRDDPQNGWNYEKSPTVMRTKGKTLGIIGLGRIGTAAALRAKAFDLKVCAYDPYMPDGRELSLGVTRYERLEDMLAVCDFISLHAPGTPETKNLINAGTIAAMKRGAILVNTARGMICDLQAVHDGLKSGQLGAAGLDVYPEEPVPADNPLIKAWRAREPWIEGRFVVTPHAAFYSDVGLEFMRRKSVTTITEYLREGRLRNCLNLEFLAASR